MQPLGDQKRASAAAAAVAEADAAAQPPAAAAATVSSGTPSLNDDDSQVSSGGRSQHCKFCQTPSSTLACEGAADGPLCDVRLKPRAHMAHPWCAMQRTACLQARECQGTRNKAGITQQLQRLLRWC
jgi:hypothetical protein